MRGNLAIVLVVLFLWTPLTAFGLVNINTAGLTELETLSGIGPSKAQAIIDYRTNIGPFAVIDDVMKVSGIGTATFSNIKDFITVGDSQAAQTQTTQASTTSTTQTTSTQTVSVPVDSYVPPPTPQVFADGGDDRVVIVGADTVFSGQAYNRSRELVDHVRFLWNFGDGSTAEGASVSHHYDYPGRYAGVLTIADNRESPSDYFTVTAEPAKLGFFVYADGSVGIQNLAGRDLDLSGWIVKSFNQLFVLPEHSRIFSGETMRIPQKTLKFWSSATTELAYPNGVTVLRAGEGISEAPQMTQSAPAVAPVAAPVAPTRPASVPQVIAESVAEEPVPVTEEESVPRDSQAAAAALSGGYWWLGAFGLALALSGAVILVRRFRETEWDIQEM